MINEAQVEAAAKALMYMFETGYPSMFRDPWHEATDADKRRFLDAATRTLVAAQGAAPPVNNIGTSAERVKNGADSLHIEPQAESDCWHEANCSCPSVQPSRTVDEEKLAEVIGKARTTSVRDNDGVKSVVMESNEQIARAVAEWLKGQGCESRGE